MDWETFLMGPAYKSLLDGPPPRPITLNDEDYQRWTRHVLAALIKRGPGCFYKLHDDERQWAERAIAERTFRWAPNDFGVVPADAAWPTVVPPMPTAPSLDEAWLGGVLTYLRAEPGRTYDVAPAEAELAAKAIAARQLEWDLEPVTVRLPSSAPHSEGPFR